MSEEESKIVVDDDWKSQVEKEKEKLDEEFNKQSSEQSSPQMPPASFSVLVSTLAMQAGSALGQLPDPTTGKPSINKPIAKHFIDTLGVLEEKTKGNLTEEEATALTDTIHQLRMLFVAMPEKLPEEKSDEKKSTIELP